MIEDDIKKIPGAKEYIKSIADIRAGIHYSIGILLGFLVTTGGGLYTINSLLPQIKLTLLISESSTGDVQNVAFDIGEMIFFETMKISLMLGGIMVLLLVAVGSFSHFHHKQKAHTLFSEHKNTLNK